MGETGNVTKEGAPNMGEAGCCDVLEVLFRDPLQEFEHEGNVYLSCAAYRFPVVLRRVSNMNI